MKIQSVHDKAFSVYGRVLSDFDFQNLTQTLEQVTERPDDGVVYVPSVAQLEADASYCVLRDHVYGGMPIQIGYCNGTNTKLNCVEYHRDSEINIGAQEFILLVARQQDLGPEWQLHTDRVEAFRVPAGVGVELYATTLHYAPCDAAKQAGFRVAVVLPRGTNTEAPHMEAIQKEDRMLRAKNKWLIAHPDAAEAQDGAYIGLLGENIDIAQSL
ncbi:MAG: DUF4867 family protein [Butyricicoccus sp.]|nr:DUF4867 family protein [Butyricicoccus sp.]